MPKFSLCGKQVPVEESVEFSLSGKQFPVEESNNFTHLENTKPMIDYIIIFDVSINAPIKCKIIQLDFKRNDAQIMGLESPQH